MQQSFEYLRVQTALDSITVENIGNVILKANNDQEFEWYLQVSTDLGWTTIKEFGPWFRVPEIAKRSFRYTSEIKEYNEKNICKRINTFLNDPKREITQVIEIDEYELDDVIRKVKSII